MRTETGTQGGAHRVSATREGTRATDGWGPQLDPGGAAFESTLRIAAPVSSPYWRTPSAARAKVWSNLHSHHVVLGWLYPITQAAASAFIGSSSVASSTRAAIAAGR